MWVFRGSEYLHTYLVGLARLQGRLSPTGLPACDLQSIAQVLHPIRRQEAIGTRLLVRHLLEDYWHLPYEGLYRQGRRPALVNRSEAYLSISHAYPFVGVLLATHPYVGIDIEHFRPQLYRVAPRVFSTDEIDWAGYNLQRLTLLWSAKEALYKAYAEGGLDYRQNLRIRPLAPAAASVLLEGYVVLDNKQWAAPLRWQIHEHQLLCLWTSQPLKPR